MSVVDRIFSRFREGCGLFNCVLRVFRKGLDGGEVLLNRRVGSGVGAPPEDYAVVEEAIFPGYLLTGGPVEEWAGVKGV